MSNDKTACDYCVNYSFDEEYDEYACAVNMDEDEYYRVLSSHYSRCPYFRMGDEYKIVRRQN